MEEIATERIIQERKVINYFYFLGLEKGPPAYVLRPSHQKRRRYSEFIPLGVWYSWTQRCK